ncbi:PREDICTED: CD63 antigen-like [Amphimedon queenslandica]|uniref:Tetraspanin n=1 Tax=Amphimedon queenslandica TaxID=400682 RepID=A0A1X7UL67_AMPQE|nr:PREDICTED: CD63 antigen-like [Amphimedon queenslandica]|eukprot:XP_011404718.1 PREDICTED: CD63 antigen-like [Amphimedon queenslandica]
MAELSSCGKLFRILFLIFNFIFLLIGIAIFALGIYLQVTTQTYSFFTGSDVVSGAVLLIVAGLITGIIAGLGFVGACMKWRPLLVIFAIILVLIILIEVITGIIGFVFRDTLRESSGDEYQTRLNNTIRDYRRNQDEPDYDENLNNAMDTLQNTLECCGTFGPSDWGTLNGDFIFENTGRLPSSCDCDINDDDNCGMVSFTYTYNNTVTMTFNGTAWTQGCYEATIDTVVYTAAVFGAVGMAFGLFEIIGVFIALGLCCCITSAGKEEYV